MTGDDDPAGPTSSISLSLPGLDYPSSKDDDLRGGREKKRKCSPYVVKGRPPSSFPGFSNIARGCCGKESRMPSSSSFLFFALNETREGTRAAIETDCYFLIMQVLGKKSKEAKKETLGQQHPLLFFSSKASGAKALNEAN